MSMAPSPLLAACDSHVRTLTLDGKTQPIPTNSVYDGAQPTLARWYPNGRLLAVALSSGVIAFHHHDKLRIIGHFNASAPTKRTTSAPASITCVDVTNGSRFLAAGTDGGAVHIWDMKSSSTVNSFSVEGAVTAVAFQHTADSRYVACATGGDVLLFSRASNRLVDSFTVSSADTSTSSMRAISARARVTALAFSPHAVNLLAVTDDSGCVNVWDISRTHASRGASAASKIGTDATYSRFTSPLRVSATDLAFTHSSSSAGLLVASLDKNIRLYDKLLRRFLFAVAAPAPVTAVAYCFDDVHVAAGHSSGATTILALDVTSRAARVTKAVPAPARPDGAAPHSTAVRSLDFQPRVSGSNGSNSSSVDAAKFAQSAQGNTRQQQPRTQRSHTSPAPSSLLSGMLLNVPERAADDTLTRYNPRDSELFSPILASTATPQRRAVLRTPASAPIVRDLSGEYGRIDGFESGAADATRSSSGVPAVDRRMSDIIPTSATAPSRAQYARFEDNPDTSSDAFLDGDAVDALLFSPPGAESSFASDAPQRTPQSLPACDEDLGSTAASKSTNLPRGMAFRRLRKSVSETTPKNMRLPPRPPRSSTTVPLQIPDAVEVDEEAAVAAANDASTPEIDDYVARQMRAARECAAGENGVVAHGNGATDSSSGPGSALAELVRRAITGEMDAVRQDLRSDILNIHTELVLSSSRQTREIEGMFKKRDALLQAMRSEIAELRRENALLKRERLGLQ